MAKYTTLLVLGIALAVFSYPANSSRVWSRIPIRNQFDPLRRNQFEGFVGGNRLRVVPPPNEGGFFKF